MTEGPFSLSSSRRRELYRSTMGRKLWLAVAIIGLASYLEYERVLYGVSGNLVKLALAICTLSALKGIYVYIRQGRFRMRFLLNGDDLVLIYPNLKQLILSRDQFRRVSPDGFVLYFASGVAPIDGLFTRKMTPMSRAVLDWLLGSEKSREALHQSRDRRDELAITKTRGLFYRIPRWRMHFYTQCIPASLIGMGLYFRYIDMILAYDNSVIRNGVLFSVGIFLMVEMTWRRSERRVSVLKAKQERAKSEDAF